MILIDHVNASQHQGIGDGKVFDTDNVTAPTFLRSRAQKAQQAKDAEERDERHHDT